jgi:hypothetical protein
MKGITIVRILDSDISSLDRPIHIRSLGVTTKSHIINLNRGSYPT